MNPFNPNQPRVERSPIFDPIAFVELFSSSDIRGFVYRLGDGRPPQGDLFSGDQVPRGLFAITKNGEIFVGDVGTAARALGAACERIRAHEAERRADSTEIGKLQAKIKSLESENTKLRDDIRSAFQRASLGAGFAKRRTKNAREASRRNGATRAALEGVVKLLATCAEIPF